jgi:hypothetical protein
MKYQIPGRSRVIHLVIESTCSRGAARCLETQEVLMHGKRARTCGTAVSIAVILALSLGGCGKKVDITYNTSASNPVIVYKSLRAISPAYNPGVPVVVVYGDGTVLRRDDAYKMTAGRAGTDLPTLLNTLVQDGFFDLKPQYTGTPLADGVTRVVTVNLASGSHQVSVDSGAGPSGWDNIAKTVNDVEIVSPEEYVPASVRLFAMEGTAPPGSFNVFPWPGAADELSEAAAGGSKGLVLQGDPAGAAWKAIQRAAKDEGEIYWTAGGKTYTGVYATPILPGIPEQ